MIQPVRAGCEHEAVADVNTESWTRGWREVASWQFERHMVTPPLPPLPLAWPGYERLSHPNHMTTTTTTTITGLAGV